MEFTIHLFKLFSTVEKEGSEDSLPEKTDRELPEYSILGRSKRIAWASLPFLALYAPLKMPLALTKQSIHLTRSMSELLTTVKEGDPFPISCALLKTMVSVISLLGRVFAHPGGKATMTAYKLILESARLASHLQASEYKEAVKGCLGIVYHILCLAVLAQGGFGIAAVLLGVNAAKGLYRSREEFTGGYYIEATGHFLYAGVRTNRFTTGLFPYQPNTIQSPSLLAKTPS